MSARTAHTLVHRTVAVILALEDLLFHHGSTEESFAERKYFGDRYVFSLFSPIDKYGNFLLHKLQRRKRFFQISLATRQSIYGTTH
jgi:hypothetical protein